MRARITEYALPELAMSRSHRIIRKTLETRGPLPNDDAASKLIYLAIRNAKKWGTRYINWSQAYLQFIIHFGDRVPTLED